MFRIVFILFLGVAVGYAFRNVHFVHSFSKCTRYTIMALLFVFGISIGCNRKLIDNLGTLGSQAALISILGIIGSFLAAILLHSVLNKKEGDNNER